MRGRTPSQVLLSAALALIFTVQIVAALIPHGRGWPFIGYSMYSEVWREGDVLYTPVMYGVRPDGRRHEIDPRTAGYASDVVWQALVPLVHGPDAERQAFLDTWNRMYAADRLTGFTIVETRQRLTRAGPMRVAPRLLVAHPEETW